MKKIIITVSFLFLLIFGSATVASADWWWPHALDVASVATVNSTVKICVDNTTINNLWLPVKSTATNTNEILATALTARSLGIQVNVNLENNGGVWEIIGIRFVTP